MGGFQLECTVFQTFLYLFLLICTAQGDDCIEETSTSGSIYGSSGYYTAGTQCWYIAVPEGTYLSLDMRVLNLDGWPCSSYVAINVVDTQQSVKFCASNSSNPKPLTAFSDINITFYHAYYQSSSFRLYFNKGNLTCAQRNHFECSDGDCILQHQVCDGVKDCQDGEDEKGCETTVRGESEIRAIVKLKSHRSTSFGWGKNTHRAITALYLSGNASFKGDNLEEELMAKQLELQTAVALLRNSTDPMTISDLSMFVNALSTTCHNPRRFYGHNLLDILAGRLATARLPNPGAYLTLCNANWTLPEHHTRSLLDVLRKQSEYPFQFDVQAMTMLALSCARNQTNNFQRFSDGSKLYNATIRQFILGQLPDGSFGNIYTTALVSQALLSAGQQNNQTWKMNLTLQYLMRELNSSTDFLSLYLSLPVLRGKSLVDLANINCTKHRKHGEDEEISDILDKMGGKMRVQYSLFIGDQKDVVHTIYLRMPENSSAYDVMRVAQVADHKYKFLHGDVSGQKYVYEIAEMANDPEAGLFWLLFTQNSRENNARHRTESPDSLTIADGDHLIMWYRTALDTEDVAYSTPTIYPESYNTTDNSTLETGHRTETTQTGDNNTFVSK